MDEADAGPDAAAAAFAALDAGEWERARGLLEAILRAGELPEARAGLGDALLWLGRSEDAARAYERAYSGFRRRGDPLQAGLCAIGLYFVHAVSLGNGAAARGWLGRLGRLAAGAGAEPLRGWHALLRAHGADDPGAAERLAREALALGRAGDDPDLELSALSQLGTVLVQSGRVDEGVALLDEALAASLAGEPRRLDTVVLASCNMITCCSHAADFERAVQWLRVAGDFTERYGSPHLYTLCRLHHGRVLLATGDWPEAERELGRALECARAGERGLLAEALAALAELRLAQGRLDEAARLLEGVEDHPAATPAVAALALARGEREAAATLLRRRLRAIGEERLESAELVELLGEADPDGAVDRAERLARLGQRRRCEAIVARGERALGRALAGAGRHGAAVAHLEAGLECFERLGMALEAARARLALAAAAAAGGARGAAVADARAALAAFERLGAARDADAAAALLRAHGVRAARGGPGGNGGGLTRREREVLALLGEGLTNRAIAERLYLAPKTVEHHVRSVLSKLGLARRAEAAAYAVRHGGGERTAGDPP